MGGKNKKCQYSSSYRDFCVKLAISVKTASQKVKGPDMLKYLEEKKKTLHKQRTEIIVVNIECCLILYRGETKMLVEGSFVCSISSDVLEFCLSYLFIKEKTESRAGTDFLK